MDKKKILRQMDRLTRPPRLEGVVKNAKINPVRKKRLRRNGKGDK